jgi:hypothetical protein
MKRKALGPLVDGKYIVTLTDGTTKDAYFIVRKLVWVTVDGADFVNGVVSWERK